MKRVSAARHINIKILLVDKKPHLENKNSLLIDLLTNRYCM
jgi:hypothetical protein